MTASPAGRFADRAEELGWAVARWRGKSSRVVTAGLGGELFVLSWAKNDAGRWQFDAGSHRIGDVWVEPWSNVAAALRIMAEPGHLVRGPDNLWHRLPFDPATSTDEEVIAAVRGKEIVWASSFSANELEARVPHISKFTCMVGGVSPGGARRVLEFVSSEGGFRSVRLAAILEVKA